MYIRELLMKLLANREARTEVMKAFKEQPIGLESRIVLLVE